MKQNLTLNNDTYASNPGNLKLNALVWTRNNFSTVTSLTAWIAGSVFFTIFVSPIFILLVLVASYYNFYYWINKREHFASGDSNGGIIVAINPTLVAVATDLTKGWGTYPVIKIIGLKGQARLKIGDKIGTVALYGASTNKVLPHWVAFNPVPVLYATQNRKVIERIMKSYNEDYWLNLERKLEQVSKPYMEGLYKVDVIHSDWSNQSQ